MKQHDLQQVYIVDDDDAIRDSLGLFLRSAGLSTREYGDADSFLRDYHPGMSGCLLLDIRMPVKSGLGLQEDLCAVGSLLPIVFITGHADVSSAVQALKSGAFDFIEKPFDNARLLEVVRQAFALDARQRQAARLENEMRERLGTLTPREAEVLEHIVDGKATKVIAAELQLSQRTVEIYRANVMQKMQARSVAQLVKMMAQTNVQVIE